MKRLVFSLALLVSSCGFSVLAAEGLSPEQSVALAKQIDVVKGWAADAKVVDAVKAINTAPLAEYKDMTQDQWKALPVLDPKVKGLAKNGVAEFLKQQKSDLISEIFVNAADGTKVAFLAKTSSWSHKGKAKHDDPMASKVWEGAVEMDESTGQQQIQVAVPVLDGGKAIGSMVVGFVVSKLK